MHLRYRFLLAAFLLVVCSSSATAGVTVHLVAEPIYWECDIADPGAAALATVYVLLERDFMSPLGEGTTGISFSAPIPPESGWFHAGDEPLLGGIISGNSQTGASVSLGGCETGTRIVIMAIHLVRGFEGERCSYFSPAPYASIGLIHSDCTFTETQARAGYGVLLNSDGSCSHATIPSDPAPADGSVGVPVVVNLEWRRAEYLCEAYLCGNDDEIYFGTTPNPPKMTIPATQVGPLAPSTTYYWRVRTGCPWSELSPVWSFTTTDRVATRPSTWGAIKALYR